jgi:type IV pilus assembly protein PilX
MVNMMINNRMNQNGFSRYSAKQKGAVLITGLIFLVVLTMLVLAIMRSATLEERMAGNSRNRQLALQAAEAILRDAEDSLFATTASFTAAFDPTIFNSTCTNGYCDAPAANSYRWKTASTWGNTTSRTFVTPASGSAFSLAGVPSQPRYIVELLGFEGGQVQKICPKVLFRITARGVGNDSSIVYLQNTYRHRPNKFADGSCG